MPDTNRPYSGTAQQGRRRAPYATLTEAEKWEWHAEVYAFRRVVLGVPAEERTSLYDPDGAWFDAALVAEAEGRLRAKRNEARERRERARSDEAQREGRAVINAWAQRKGYADVDAYADAVGIHWSDAYRQYAEEMGVGAAPRKRGDGPLSVAEAAGIRATEIAADPPPGLLPEGDPRVQARLQDMGVPSTSAA